MSKSNVSPSQKILLDLLGRSLFHVPNELPRNIDWDELNREMKYQTVLPLVVSSLRENELSSVSPELRKQWRDSISRIFLNNERLKFEQKQVLNLLFQNGINCVVLKGTSAAINYPNPELRILGDIDLLVEPSQLTGALNLLVKNGYLENAAGENHCHQVAFKEGIKIELHKSVNGIQLLCNSSKKADLEQLFSSSVEHCRFENDIPILSDECQALTLLFHKIHHVRAGGFGLRQLCDWAVFVNKKMTPQMWNKLEPKLEALGIAYFTKVVTRVCVEYIHLPQEKAPWSMDCDSTHTQWLISAVLQDGNFGKKGTEGKIGYTVKQTETNEKAYIRFIVESLKKNWPLCDKYPVLLVVAPIFAYINYRKRYKGKKRRSVYAIGMYRSQRERIRLIKALNLSSI